MWNFFASLFAILPFTTNYSMFKKEQIIFSSTFNITRILVPANEYKYTNPLPSEIPTIFFTVSDPKLEGGSCIYVLEDFAAYEIMEGGRDSTADYLGRTVYFGSVDGIYQYDRDSLSAKRLGIFRDDIIQIQKANGTDKIYILTKEHKLFVIENNGTMKTKITNVVCATEFVLDTSNNIYFVECGIKVIHIVKANGVKLSVTPSVIEEFDDIQLLRPAFIMEESIPFFGDGTLYILHVNGSCVKKDLKMTDKPSAFSVDAALYLAAALEGKIYEFNVMESMLQSMISGSGSPENVTRMIMSILENTKEGDFGLRKI